MYRKHGFVKQGVEKGSSLFLKMVPSSTFTTAQCRDFRPAHLCSGQIYALTPVARGQSRKEPVGTVTEEAHRPVHGQKIRSSGM